jgi:hypothetical protein
MSDVPPPGSDAKQSPTKRRRLWLWFFTGFLLVLLILAVVYPMYYYDGGSVRQTRLWQYYLLEIQLAVNSSANLGPTSGNSTVAFTTALMHVAVSCFANAVVMCIGWATQKRSQVS